MAINKKLCPALHGFYSCSSEITCIRTVQLAVNTDFKHNYKVIKRLLGHFNFQMRFFTFLLFWTFFYFLFFYSTNPTKLSAETLLFHPWCPASFDPPFGWPIRAVLFRPPVLRVSGMVCYAPWTGRTSQ